MQALRWPAAAFAVGIMWSLAETLIVRHVFNSGFYFSRSFASAFNGRVVFYGLTAIALSILLAVGIGVWERLRRRGLPPRVVAKRALIATAALAAWANLSLLSLLFAYRITGLAQEEKLLFVSLAALPSAAVVISLVFLLRGLGRRFKTGALTLRYLSYSLLTVAVITGLSSLGYERYKLYSRPNPPGLPDVVVITLDAWRASAFSDELTPAIRKFARQNAVVFTEARAPSSWTLPSFAATFTGSYNITDVSGFETRGDPRPTWAEIMRDNGYDTYAVMGNRHLDIYRHLLRGFSNYDYVGFHPALAAVHYYDTAFYFATRGRSPRLEVPGTVTRRLTDKTRKLLRQPSKRPKFIWVHTLDPHSPYRPLPEVLAKDAPRLLNKWHYATYIKHLPRENSEIFEGLYKCEVKSTDVLISRLLSDLAERTNTLVIISSDHGEEFFEHGRSTHGNTLYGEVCRVPLIVALPRNNPKGVRVGEVDSPVSLIDVAPSVLNYLGLTLPPTMVGRGDLFLGARGDGDAVYTTLNQPGLFRAAIIKDNKKVIALVRPGRLEIEYFDLAGDPGERRPLRLDAEGEELKVRLLKWINDNYVAPEASFGGSGLFGGKAELRALGYM